MSVVERMDPENKTALRRLRAGIGKSDITTSSPVWGLRDPLYAKALALDDGVTRAVIVAMGSNK